MVLGRNQSHNIPHSALLGDFVASTITKQTMLHTVLCQTSSICSGQHFVSYTTETIMARYLIISGQSRFPRTARGDLIHPTTKLNTLNVFLPRRKIFESSTDLGTRSSVCAGDTAYLRGGGARKRDIDEAGPVCSWVWEVKRGSGQKTGPCWRG